MLSGDTVGHGEYYARGELPRWRARNIWALLARPHARTLSFLDNLLTITCFSSVRRAGLPLSLARPLGYNSIDRERAAFLRDCSIRRCGVFTAEWSARVPHRPAAGLENISISLSFPGERALH